MAWTNGNSVALTVPYAYRLTPPAGLNASGYPCILAIAFRPNADATNNTLLAIDRAGGNHWIALRIATGMSGVGTTTGIQMQARAGGGGTLVTETSTAVCTEDTWCVVVGRFEDADNWDIAVDSASLESFTSVGGPTTSAFGQLDIFGKRDNTEYVDGDVAWAAYWGANDLSDAQMEAIADGTDSPSDHAPDELIWFNGTTAYNDESETSSPTQQGAGSIATEASDPDGWPPTASGGVIRSLARHGGLAGMGGIAGSGGGLVG